MISPYIEAWYIGHRGIVVKHAAAVSFWVAVHCPKG
jgi:hypothetical protein